MKRIVLYNLISFSLPFLVFISFVFLYQSDALLFQILVFFFCVFTGYLLFKYRLISVEKAFSLIEPQFDNLIDKNPMSYSLNSFFRIDGMGYLLNDRLIFLPYSMDKSNERIEILLSDILATRSYKRLLVFGRGIEITMKSHARIRLRMDATSGIYRKLTFLSYSHSS